MMIAETIQQYVRKLPVSLQAEVLDFAEYLLRKAGSQSAQEDGQEWSSLSLSSAMRGMVGEATPDYTLADLKDIFQ